MSSSTLRPAISATLTIVSIGLACLLACQVDVTSGSAETEPNSTSNTGLSFGTDDTGTTDVSTTDDPTGDGDTGDGDPSSPLLDAGVPAGLTCAELDCSPGDCVMLEDVAYCDCPADTIWSGVSCDPCLTLDAAMDHDIGLHVFDVQGSFLLDGGPVPAQEYDDANIWLENRRTGDRVRVGNTHDGPFSIRVTPGVYDVVYEVESPGAQMPHNPRAVIGQIGVFENWYGDIDIPVSRVSGAATLDRGPTPKSEYDDALLMLRDDQTGAELLLGNTNPGTYLVNVVPGSYDLVYRVQSPGENVPHNDGAVLDAGVVISGASQTLNVDIPVVTLTGVFTINGATPPVDEYNDANVMLSSATGGTVRLGNTHDGGYTVRVIPDSYELVYIHESGLGVPRNRHGRFGAPVVVGGDQNLPVEIPMVTVTGAFTINGAPPPANEFDDGVIELRDGDDIVPLGNTHDGSYQVNVIPGSYEVYYSLETAGGGVPENKQARVMPATDFGGGNVDIDVEAVAISGIFTLGGGQPPSSVYEDARLYLRNASTGDSVLLGSTHGGSYSAVVVPGDYELVYSQEFGSEVPGNQSARLESVNVAAAMTRDIDVPFVDLAGAIMVDGVLAPNQISDSGQLVLRTPEGDSVLLGESFEQAYAAKLVSGSYSLYYRVDASVMMPENTNGHVTCLRVE